MPNIDEKVVQMTFDNKQFEKGVADSVKSLDELKKALEFDNMKSSLSRLEDSTSIMKSSLDSILQSTQKVAHAFTPLGKLGQQALERLSNAALNAGKNFTSMVTGLSGMKAGQTKFEKYTKSVQTITNATGKSIQDVEKVLDDLTWYTDQTSYDFAEMVSSIGKFTSVGIDLERSEKAMEGIANWAAKAGAGKMEANRAMYNISQAMGVGAMKKIDWKSIENANMATKEFKEMAIDTAIQLGVLADAGDGVGVMLQQTKKGVRQTVVDYQTFSETLKDGWLNSEVMMATLERYADRSTEFGNEAFEAAKVALTFSDAMDAVKDSVSSGWMTTFKYLFGNMKEAGRLFTGLCDSIIEFTDLFSSARNEVLKNWHVLGGYSAAIEAASNVWETFMNIVHLVIDAWQNVFPPITGKRLAYITEKVRDATAAFRDLFGIDTETEIEEAYEEEVDFAKKISLNLKKGANPEEIYKLQEQLKKHGYMSDKAIADGIYGKETEAAVKKLQKALGVDVTGVWDAATSKAASSQKVFYGMEQKTRKKTLKNVEEVTELYWKQIDLTEKFSSNLSTKSKKKSEEVRLLQEQLIKMGYLTDQSVADGIYGKKTEAAVKKLQKFVGVEETGVWDAATREAASAHKLFVTYEQDVKTTYVETEGLTLQSQMLQSTLAGLFALLDMGKRIWENAIRVVTTVAEMFLPIIDEIIFAIAHFSTMIVNLDSDIGESKAIETFADGIIAAFTPLAIVIQLVAGAIHDFFAGYDEFLLQTGKDTDKAKRVTFKSFFEYLLSRFTDNALFNGIYNFGKTFINVFVTIKKTITGIISDIVKWVSEKFDELFNGKAVKVKGITVRKKKKGGLIGAFVSLYDSIKSIYSSISNFILSIYNTIFKADEKAEDTSKRSGIMLLLDGILYVVTLIAKGVAVAFAGIAFAFSAIFNAFRKFLMPLTAGIRSFYDSIKSAYENGEIKSFSDAVQKLWAAFSGTKVGQTIIKIGDDIKKAFNSVIEYIKTNYPSIYTFLSSLWGTITEFFSYDTDKSLGDNIVSKFMMIKDGIIGAITDLQNDFKTAFPKTYDFLSSAITKIQDIFFPKNDDKKSDQTSRAMGLIGLPPAERFAKLSIFDKIYNFVSNFFSNISDLATNAYSGIQKIFGNVSRFLKIVVIRIIGKFLMFKKYLMENFPGIYEFLKNTIDKIGASFDKLREFLKFDESKGFFENVKDKLKAIGNYISEFSKKAYSTVSRFLKIVGIRIIGKFLMLKKYLKENFPGIYNFLNNVIEKIGVSFESLKKFFKFDENKSFFENIKSKFKALGDFIKAKIEDIKSWFVGLFTVNENGELGIFTELKSLFASIQPIIDDLVGSFKKLFGIGEDDAAGIFSGGEGGFTSVLDKVVEFYNNIKNMGFDKIIKGAIAGLAGFALFKGIKGIGDISKIIKDVGVSGLAFGDDSAGLLGRKGLGGTALQIAGAVAAISLSVFLLSKIDAKAAKEGVDLFTTVIEYLAGAIIAVNGTDKLFGKDNDVNFGSQVMQLGIGIAAMAIALSTLVKLIIKNKENPGTLETALIILAGMLVAIGILANIVNKSNTEINISDSKGVLNLNPILQMCLGILALVYALKKMIAVVKANWKNPAPLIASIGIIAAMLLGLTGLQILLLKFGESNDTGKVKGILAMCIGVYVLTLAFKKMVSVIKDNVAGDLWMAIGFIEAMLWSIGGIIILLAKASKDSNLGNNIVNVVGIIAITACVCAIANEYGKMVKIIKENEAGDVWMAFGFIEAMLWSIGGIVILLSKFSATADFKKMILNIVGIVVVAAAICAVAEVFAHAVNLVKDIDATVMLVFFGSVIGAIVALALVAALLSVIPTKMLIAGGISLVVLIGILCLTVSLISDIAQDAMAKFGNGLWQLSSYLKTFSETLNDINWSAMQEAAGFMLAILPVIVTAVIDAGTGKIDQAVDIMNKLWGMSIDLSMFAEMIGTITPATLVSSKIAIALVTDAQTIASTAASISVPAEVTNGNLALLGAHLQNYSTMLEEVSSDNDETAKTVANDAQTIANSLNAVTLNDGVSTTITNLGAALSLYYKEIAGIGKVNENGEALSVSEQFEKNLTKVDSQMISEAFTALAGAIPTDQIDTLKSFATGGDNDLTSFALGVEALGTALKSYGDNISGINVDAVTAANTAIDGIVGLDEHLKGPNYSGISDAMGDVKDDNGNIAAFSGHITTLGGALQSYIDNISGADKDKIGAANDALDTFLKVQQYFNGSDGISLNSVFEIFSGLKGKRGTMHQFGNNIGALGQALGKYINATKDIDSTKVKTANDTIGVLATLNDKLPKTGGLISLLAGDKSLGEFAGNMSLLGDGMAEFAGKVSGANFTNVKESGDAINSISLLALRIDKNSGSNIKSVGDNIESFGSSLQKFEGIANSLSYDNIGNALALIERILGWTNTFTNAISIDDYGNVTNVIGELGKGIKTAMDQIAKLSSIKYNTGFMGSGGTSFADTFNSLGKMTTGFIAEGIINSETEDGVLKSALSKALLIALNNVTTTGLDEVAVENGSSFARSLLEVLVGDTDLAPTIRPVLELRGIEQDAVTLHDLVNPSSTLAIRAVLSTESAQAIAGSIVSVKDTIRSSMDDLLAKMDERDRLYENKLNAVVNRVGGIKNEIGKMKVVLDKSRVVGGIINDIDKKLGDRWFDAGRVSGRL